MATKLAEEAPEKLKYQTWVLKVSIDCEGCKKKVKKVVQGIEGVYTTTVDSQRQKVTVTGNVDAETLIKKLQRSGKHAELLPETKPEKKEKKPGKSKNNGKQKDEKHGDQQEITDDNNPVNNSAENKPVQGGDNGGKAAAGHGQPPEQGSQGGESNGNNSGGSGGTKKKKKGQNSNSNNNIGENTGDAHPVAIVDSASPMEAMNLSPPLQHMYSYPPSIYYAPPLHGLNYNTSYPSPNTSYYTTPMHDVANMYPYPQRYQLPPPPSDPIVNFTGDDNESGCSIM